MKRIPLVRVPLLELKSRVEYATALRMGTEVILRRFTWENVQHPTYKALVELGEAIKTCFLCRYTVPAELTWSSRHGVSGVAGMSTWRTPNFDSAARAAQSA